MLCMPLQAWQQSAHMLLPLEDPKDMASSFFMSAPMAASPRAVPVTAPMTP